jgi:2-polyprenyl-6-methoxyphenol hydroxylase-like FAD-dependent oxidoreductase
MQRLRIRIVGGSLGGLFAAVLLSKDGHDVRVFERSEHGLGGRGAGLVGQRDTFAILRAAGCEHVARIGVVSDDRIIFDRSGAVISRVAAPQMQISWDRLYQVFRKLVASNAYSLGKEVVSVGQDETSACLTFADGVREPADLVIGADGVASVVRTAVNAGPSPSSYAGYVAWRGLFPEKELPTEAGGILLDQFAFFEMPRSHILGYLVAGPDGETTIGKRRYNWVWYRPIAQNELSIALTDANGGAHDFSLAPGSVPDSTQQALVADAERLLPPPFAAAVKAERQPFIQAIFDYRTPRMKNGRLALLGDAAFVVRPHTAMGVSKAAGDAIAIRRYLSMSQLPEALAGYDIERRRIGESIAAHGRQLGAKLE